MHEEGKCDKRDHFIHRRIVRLECVGMQGRGR